MHRLALLLLAATPACMSYAPPIRSPGYGAPGRLREGQLEVGGGIAHPGQPGSGGPYLAYAVRDWANVELGGEFAFKQHALGFLGGRFTHAPKRERKLHGALDGELGFGFGAGGNLYTPSSAPEPVPRPWYTRPAAGGYTGGGAGYHFHFFSIFARTRIQVAAADGLPTTLYGAAHGGIQLRIARHVDLHGSGGWFNLINAQGHTGYWFWDVGAAVYFDLRRKQRPQARRPALSL